MKKLTVVTIVICLLLSLTGCGSSGTGTLEKRLDALEKENARLAEQLDSIAKKLGIPETSKDPSESQESGQSQAVGTSEKSTDKFKKIGFYLDESNASHSWYKYDTPQGNQKSIQLGFTNDWSVVEDGNRLVLELKKDWINATLVLEIDSSISSAVECERKIRTITDSFGSEGVTDEYSFSFSDHFSYYLRNEQYMEPIKGRTGKTVDFDNTWYIGIIDNNQGAYYCHEISNHTNITNSTNNYNDDIDLVYSLLKYEGYTFLPENQIGALHVTTQVTKYNWQEYYNSLDTTIEKNNAQNDRNRLFEMFDQTRCLAELLNMFTDTKVQ